VYLYSIIVVVEPVVLPKLPSVDNDEQSMIASDPADVVSDPILVLDVATDGTLFVGMADGMDEVEEDGSADCMLLGLKVGAILGVLLVDMLRSGEGLGVGMLVVTEGERDGTSLGFADRMLLGLALLRIAVGVDETLIDGSADSITLGLTLGVLLGVDVGLDENPSEGVDDGEEDGKVLGSADDSILGLALCIALGVRETLGLDERLIVGMAVGITIVLAIV